MQKNVMSDWKKEDCRTRTVIRVGLKSVEEQNKERNGCPGIFNVENDGAFWLEDEGLCFQQNEMPSMWQIKVQKQHIRFLSMMKLFMLLQLLNN